MASAITLPYSTKLMNFGSALSSTYTWYEQWYVYPTITDTMASQARITMNSIKSSERTKRVKLPSGYTQLEYIESDGNQYIDTQFAVTPDNYNKLKYVADMESLGSNVSSSRSITANNIGEFFTVTNGQYFFAGSGSTFTTNNLNVPSTTATTTLTALYDMPTVSFTYSYSSESGYDKLTITCGGTTVANALSGATTSATYSGSLTKGQTIVFTYTKDSSGNSNDDKCTFSAMSVSTKHDGWAVDGTGASGSNAFHVSTYNDIIYYGNGQSDVSTGKRYDYIRHTFTNDALNGVFSVSDLYETTYTPVVPTLSLNFYLFAYNKNNTAYKGIIRHWGSELYENDVLVHKFVPCKEDSTGAIGMYDTVSNTFFGNNGTGTFAYAELKSGYVDVSFTIYSKNAITRTGTSGYTCTTFTYESQPTIKVNNVNLGESIELYDGELTTTVTDNGAGTAVSGSITHSATVTIQIPRNWFIEENSEWNFSISDALMIMNTSANKTNTYTFASFNVAPLFNIWVRKPIGLPEGYTQLKYIESTGTQYVDTGFAPNQDTRVVMDVQLTSAPSASVFLFGGREASGSNTYGFLWYSTPVAFRTDYNTVITNMSDTIKSTERLSVDKDKNITVVNGINCTHTYASFQSPANLVLLAVNTNGTVTLNASAKLYSCQIYDNDVLIRDFIPCINPDNIVGLYDTVNATFYGDAAGGAFIPAPTSYTPVEYIESDGASYIDTEFYPNQDTRMVIDYEVLNTNTAEAHISSARSSATTPLWTLYTNASLGIATRYGTGAVQTISSPTGAGRYLFDKNKNILNIDGIQVNEVTYEAFFVTSTLTIFARNDGTAINNYHKGRLYSYQLYDNDVLIRDYIPVIDSNNIACLYDKVTKTFFHNKGTGTFMAGSSTGSAVQLQTPKSILRKARKVFIKKDGAWQEATTLMVKVGGEFVQ